MGFVNEFIPEEDVEKYGLKAIDEKFVVGGTEARDWTIDRERNIYIRNVANGGSSDPDIRNQTKWSFYWHGYTLYLRLDLIAGGGGRGEPGWSHWKLVWLNDGGNCGLTTDLKEEKEQILADLKEALVAYKDFGIYSTNTDYQVILEIDGDCAI